MNARLLKSRLKQAESSVERWRKRLRIDPKWSIHVAALPKQDGAVDLIQFGEDMAAYWEITLGLYPYFLEMSKEEWKEHLDVSIMHEILHLIQWQFSSFAKNMLGKQCVPELEKLEEQVVQQLEEILSGVRWK